MDFGSLISAGASLLGGNSAKKEANKQRKHDFMMANNQIKFRVNDAKRSGVHPLYALGAPSHSPSPINTGAMGQAIANAGDAIGRGISSAYEKQLKAKNLENIQADIDLKKAQATGYIAQAKRASDNARAPQVGRKNGNDNYLVIGGKKVYQDKDWLNVEDYSQRYGEGADFIGPYIYHKDMQKTLKMQREKKRKIREKYPYIPRRSRDQGGTKYYNERF